MPPQMPTGIAPFIDPLILSRLPLLNANQQQNTAAQAAACMQQSLLQKNFIPLYRNNILSQVKIRRLNKNPNGAINSLIGRSNWNLWL